MKTKTIGAAAVCLLVGSVVGFAFADKVTGGGVAVFKGKPAKEGAYAALAEAEKLSGGGSWELIGVGRVYYLSGDKAKGQEIFDHLLRVASGERTKSEMLGYGDAEFVPWQIGATM